MHCPKCGQQQVTDEMRFCSRCGFSLGIVTELLVTGGTLPERETESLGARFSGRKRGKRLGLLLMMTGMVLAIIAGIIHDSLVRDPLNTPGLAGKLLLFLPAIIIGVAGFVRFLYAWLLETNVQSGTAPVCQSAATKSGKPPTISPPHPRSTRVRGGGLVAKPAKKKKIRIIQEE